MSLEFSQPALLALLLVLLPVVSWWRRSRANLPPGRARAALAVRCLLLLCLVLALAGLRWTAPADRTAVVFLVDRSLSMADPSLDRALEYVREARAGMEPRDAYGVVVFGRDAVVERSVGPAMEAEPAGLRSVVDRDGTDLAGALRLAQAVLPGDASRRLVVLSDGNATAGDALTEARLAASLGTEVWTVTAPAPPGGEVLVESVEAPARPAADEPFDVQVTVGARQAGRALLTVTRNDREVARQAVDLEEGRNVFLVPQRLQEGGAWRYEARIESAGDGQAANNRASAVAAVRGRARVLFATGEGAPPGPVPEMLRAQGLDVKVVGAGGLPRSPAEYAGYGAVVFSDLSALQVPEVQMGWIRSLVREGGMGFAMLGGPESFVVGGWYRTPVEDVLPVDMDIRKKKRAAVLALVLVLDKSGSMAEVEGPATRLALAREAGIAAAELLTPHDLLGALGFDSASRWVVRLAQYPDPGKAAQALATLEPGGGTDLYPALKQALDAMDGVQVPMKHAIVLSDGRVEPGDFDTLAARAKAGRVTVTTVAVGTDADLNFMRDLAAKTGGRSYLASRASMLPRIFTRETVIAARAAFSEKPFRAREASSHPVTRGVDLAGAPALLGYDLSTLRPAPAVAVLEAADGDPLLAVGRAGLGRTAAFTSDAGRRWARPWAAWPGFAPLMAQTVRWIMADAEGAGLDVTVEAGAGGKARAVVDARAGGGDFLDLAALRGRALAPDGREVDLEFLQTGPGRYEAEFAAPQAGAWLVQVSDPETGRASAAPWFLPYSPEFARLEPDPSFMARLARAGAGRAEAPPAEVFRAPARPQRVAREAWPALLAAALLLLPLDVALRRVFLPEGWAGRFLAGLRGRPVAPVAADPTLAALKLRRESLRAEPAGEPARPAKPPADQAPQPRPPAPPPPVPAPKPPPASTTGPAAGEAPAGGTLARLKKARERARGEDNQTS